MRVIVLSLVIISLAFLPSSQAWGDTFGGGASSFDIEFALIGNPGNLPDLSGVPYAAGSVPYAYRIGRFEISEQMIDKANALGGLGITKDTRGPDKPATSVSWYEAAQFVNWLNTSAGATAAYKFDGGENFQLWAPGDPGYDAANLYRNSLARYFLPTDDEWYKAAYYDPAAGVYYNYPTGSNEPPIAVSSGTIAGTAVYGLDENIDPGDIMQAGGLSPFGTMGQGGNANEWQETASDLLNNAPDELRSRRGAPWGSLSSSLSSSVRGGGLPSMGLNGVGFRVASVIPEPSAAVLVGIAALIALCLTRRIAT